MGADRRPAGGRGVAADHRSARTRLVEGLPDLGGLFDGLGLPGPVSLGDPSMERTRLFEAVFRLHDRPTRQQPVLLVVDDIHWADPAPLAMLHYVVRGMVDRRFLPRVFIERTPMCPAIPRCGSCCRTRVGVPDYFTEEPQLIAFPHNPDAPQADPL